VTLIVSVVSPNCIVQTADRKITDGHKNVDLDRDKLLFCTYDRARFSIAFTGDAEVFNAPPSVGPDSAVFPERVFTAYWAGATISALMRTPEPVETIIDGFQKAVNEAFKPPSGLTIFVVAGYKYYLMGNQLMAVPFWGTVDNCQVIGQKYKSKILYSSFDISRVPQDPPPPLHIQLDGYLPAVSKALAEEFVGIVRQAILIPNSGLLIADEAVRLIGEASKSTHTIGKQSISIPFNAIFEGECEPQYYDFTFSYGRRRTVTPLLVRPSGYIQLGFLGSNPKILKMRTSYGDGPSPKEQENDVCTDPENVS